jgi:predicted TIM-barrel fold metal-dependent hydrolase
VGIVDACAHPVLARPADLREYLAPPYHLERLNAPGGGTYPVPIDEHVPWSYRGEGWPGSDPAVVDDHVLAKPDADYAVLLPLTRGLPADARVEAAIAAATNRWLAETWLGEYNAHGRYRGTIRVSPRSPRDAVAEIERWASHPHFVQVGVPLETHVLYGEQAYFEIWRAAADHGLPVAIHADRAGGVLNPPSTQGYPQYFLEDYSQQPIYTMAQLTSLIAHGVFERLPSLVFVFADGGFDYVQTLTWRMDKEWRASRSEVPWVRQSPRHYLRDHARFVVHRSEGPEDPADYARFIEINDLAPLLMYGSNYPSWDYLEPEALAELVPSDARAGIMSDNARQLYGLPVPAASS